MWVHPTVTASTMIAHFRWPAQGQMSHEGCGNIWERKMVGPGIVPDAWNITTRVQVNDWRVLKVTICAG